MCVFTGKAQYIQSVKHSLSARGVEVQSLWMRVGYFRGLITCNGRGYWGMVFVRLLLSHITILLLQVCRIGYQRGKLVIKGLRSKVSWEPLTHSALHEN